MKTNIRYGPGFGSLQFHGKQMTPSYTFTLKAQGMPFRNRKKINKVYNN